MSDFTEYYKKAWELGLIKHTEEIREAEARGMLVGFKLAAKALWDRGETSSGYRSAANWLIDHRDMILKPNQK